MAENRVVISGSRLVLGPPVPGQGAFDILIGGGRIEEVRPSAGPPIEGARIIDARGLVAAPGFIDLHVHGGKGHDFMDATEEAFRAVGEYHAAGGTTSYMPTTATDAYECIIACVDTAARCREARVGGPEILGVHVEGPYMAPRRHGCHDHAFVRRPSPEENRGYLERAHIIRRMTLAPELPGALEFIRELTAAGIASSGGHSDASAREVFRAIDAGMKAVTHLFCAMSSTKKDGPYRIAGMLEAALLDDRLSAELIADMRHVPRELLLLALKIKGPDRVFFVTDAMRGAGMPDGVYTFGSRRGTPAIVEGGISRNLDNTGFASSTARMIDLVRNAVEHVGLSLETAVRLASAVPASVAGVSTRKGAILPGYDADVVLLRPGPPLELELVMAKGEIAAYHNGPRR